MNPPEVIDTLLEPHDMGNGSPSWDDMSGPHGGFSTPTQPTISGESTTDSTLPEFKKQIEIFRRRLFEIREDLRQLPYDQTRKLVHNTAALGILDKAENDLKCFKSDLVVLFLFIVMAQRNAVFRMVSELISPSPWVDLLAHNLFSVGAHPWIAGIIRISTNRLCVSFRAAGSPFAVKFTCTMRREADCHEVRAVIAREMGLDSLLPELVVVVSGSHSHNSTGMVWKPISLNKRVLEIVEEAGGKEWWFEYVESENDVLLAVYGAGITEHAMVVSPSFAPDAGAAAMVHQYLVREPPSQSVRIVSVHDLATSLEVSKPDLMKGLRHLNNFIVEVEWV